MAKGLIKQGLLHDIDKFRPSIFIPYAKWVGGNKGCVISHIVYGMNDDVVKCHELLKQRYENAKARHHKRSPHHWKYWTGEKFDECIPEDILKEMMCDWEATSEVNNTTPQRYYLENYYQIILNDVNRLNLETALKLNTDMKSYVNYTIEQVFDDTVLSKPENIQKEMVKVFNNVYESVNYENDINMYELIMKSRNKLQ
jgi:hypothetical protein